MQTFRLARKYQVFRLICKIERDITAQIGNNNMLSARRQPFQKRSEELPKVVCHQITPLLLINQFKQGNFKRLSGFLFRTRMRN